MVALQRPIVAGFHMIMITVAMTSMQEKQLAVLVTVGPGQGYLP